MQEEQRVYIEDFKRKTPDEILNHAYEYLVSNKLVERGIPPEEIAFIHAAYTDTKKKELFAKKR